MYVFIRLWKKKNTVSLPGFCLTQNSPEQQRARLLGTDQKRTRESVQLAQEFQCEQVQDDTSKRDPQRACSQTIQWTWERQWVI